MKKQNPGTGQGFTGAKKGTGNPFLPSLAAPVKAYWLSFCKRRRLFQLRRLHRHYYAQAVRREWDHMASAKVDAITFLLESEGEEVGS